MAQQPDDEQSNILMIFLGTSALIVLVTVIGFVILLVSSRLSGNQASSGSGAAPYGLATRALPTAKDLKALLADHYGGFKRTTLSGSLDTFMASYASGSDKITLNGSRAVSVRAAQAGVTQIARVTGGFVSSDQKNGGDPSYLLNAPEKGTARLSWSHDRWFFDVQASSKAALDDFMKVFPY